MVSCILGSRYERRKPQSMTTFTLGTNLGFATNRFPEPEEWARIVSQELGLSSVQIVSDLLNPFWPQDVLQKQVERVQEATGRWGIELHSLMTGGFTRLNHLMYPHRELRQTWLDWFKRFIDLGATLGVSAVGSHFGILSVADSRDPERYEQRVAEAVRSWQRLSHYAAGKGIDYLFYETMSIPREMGYTVARARQLYERVNVDVGIPFRVCLDVGHAPHPDERDPYLWLSELGDISPMVHLQQTEQGHSRHWPFTDEYNAKGVVDPRRVLETITATGIDDVWLGFEIAHRERYEVEPLVLPELAASAHCWRRLLPQDGPWTP